MESLDLMELMPRRAPRTTLPPAKKDDHWLPGRLRLHMAHAEPYRRLHAPIRRLPPLWRWWMNGAMLAVATSALAGVIAAILRRTL